MSDAENSINSEEIYPQSERLQALSPEEYELLWGQPAFSVSDRVRSLYGTGRLSDTGCRFFRRLDV